MNALFAGLIAAIVSLFGAHQPIARAPIVNAPPTIALPASYQDAASVAAAAESIGRSTGASSSPASVSPDRTQDASTSAPITKNIIEYAPLAGNYVTQSELQTQLDLVADNLRSLIAANSGGSAKNAAVPQNVAAGGNAEVPYAAVSNIGNLSGVTISNANLTASEIPDLSGSYLSLDGGTLTGAFNDASTATSTLSGSISIGGNLNFNGALLQNGLPFAGSQWTTSGSNILYSSGDVGIATTSPAFPLDVGGTIDAASYFINGKTTLSTANNWLAIGPGAGTYFASDGSNPLVAVGVGALASTSPGYGDVAVGYQALATASGDFFDTAVGLDALQDIGNGNNNDMAAFGYSTLANTTSGVNDTAFGAQAMISNLTGWNDIAVGKDALGQATSTGNTVAVGWQAGCGLPCGSSSGDYTNLGGTYVGYGSGEGLQTGSNYDIFLGYQSGVDVTTGSDNILIGSEINTGGTHLKTGSNDILIGYNANTPATTANNFLNIGGVLFGTLPATSSATSFSVSTAGMIAVGTSTPSARMTVWGIDNASSSPAFNVANSASTTVFAVFDGGNAELSGSLSQSSDERLKTNIQSLDASSSLSLIDELNPVTFNWIDPNKGTTPQLGFIAQQVLPIFPNLVATTAATALTPDGTLSLNYIGLISPVVSAIQELDQQLSSIASAITGFADSFTTNDLTYTRATGADLTLSQELCIDQSDGTPVCVTGDQLAAVLAATSVPQAPEQESGGSSDSDADTTAAASDTPPVIQINGDNPAIVQVGDTYDDLGATITGPEADLDLGIQTFINGIQTSSVEIDTSAAATDTIQYVATDQNGLTSTSTRTVIVEAPSIVPSDDASSTTTTNDDAGTTTAATSTSS